ncbi:MAG: plethodontid receptivity factor PRF [Bacteroides sp.]|nr:plethodontid receptivity factor PRF [Bacteroides sp.]
MKRFMWLVCALLLAVSAGAQPKVIEKSAKKVPGWMNTAVDGYLIVTVNANSLAEAQTKALTEITERIIQSVASNVSVSKKNVLSEVNVNGNIESTDAFSQVSKIKSANLPFLKGISLSNVEEIYWEKAQDKATKKEHYDYSVKYPFSRLEQRKLTAEFEALDAEKVAKYKELEQKIQEIESVDEIKQAITELNTLSEYFFDDVRLSQVKGLTARYKQLYESLTLTGTFLESGKYQCQVLLDGSPVRVSVKPKVTSNCASQISARPSDEMFIISYNAEDCLPEEENFLNISLVVEGKRLQHKAFLNEVGVGAASFSVIPEGKLILTADSVADRKIFNINIRLTLNNRGGTPFGLKSLELHVPEISTPIIFDDIDGVYKTKGIIQIKALAEGEFTAKEKKSAAFSFVQGVITFVNPVTGAVERTKLSLPYITNWE